MKIKIKDFYAILLYVLMFISALSYMRYTVLEVSIWMHVHLLAMLLIDGICLSYIIFFMFRKSEKLNFLSLFLLFFVFFELSTSVLHSLLGIRALVDIIPWPFLFIVFNHYSKNNNLPSCFSTLTLCGITLIILFSIPNIYKARLFHDGDAIFSTYYCFAFLPMVYLSCSKNVSKFYSIVVALVMLFTLKRGAFLIVSFGITLYYFIMNYIEGSSKKILRRYVFLFTFLVFIALIGNYIIDKFGLNILVRLENSLEDSGSGRLQIWEEVLWYFNISSFSDKIFGHGFHAVFSEVMPLGIQRFAHNSYIETLYDYGIIGLVLLLYFNLKLVVKSIKMLRIKYKLTPVMFFSLVPMVILGLISYFFEESTIIIPISVVWGICFGLFNRENKSRKFTTPKSTI